MRSFLFILTVLIALGTASLGCRHELILPEGPDDVVTDPQDTIPDPPVDTADYSGVPCSPDTAYFQNQVLPLLVSACAKSGCHDAVTQAEGINLTTYAGAFSDGIVKPFNPTGSKLYKVLIDTDPDDRMPRPPDPPLTQEQKALIYKWIQQGALNNVCNENYGGCDTVGVTYAGFIAPLMANKCQGCHSGANASGNIRLTTYNEVRTQALNGRLYGSISWQTGYRKMPEGGAQFSACFQNKIKAWINAGMPQ